MEDLDERLHRLLVDFRNLVNGDMIQTERIILTKGEIQSWLNEEPSFPRPIFHPTKLTRKNSDGDLTEPHTLHILHEVEQTLWTYPNAISFPKGDFSVISVMCPRDQKQYEYNSNEIYPPASDESDLRDRVIELEKELKRLESRLSYVESPEWIARKEKELETQFKGFLNTQIPKTEPQKQVARPYG